MLLRIPALLTPEEVATCRQTLEQAPWEDGRATAGQLAAQVKHNLQLPASSPLRRKQRPASARPLQVWGLPHTGAFPVTPHAGRAPHLPVGAIDQGATTGIATMPA